MPTTAELRPITLLEALRKVFFSLYTQKIMSCWEKNNALAPSQHGGRVAHGTDTASLQVINILEQTMTSNSPCCITSYDKRRAFDSLSKVVKKLAWYRDHHDARYHGQLQ